MFPAGEGSKNFSTLSDILEFLASEHLTRSDCVAALGGGVVGDMAGFAAASYLRASGTSSCPPRCSPPVDSCRGRQDRHRPQGREEPGRGLSPARRRALRHGLPQVPAAGGLADGAAEAIKTGVLCDESLFALFEDGTLTAAPAEVIARCVQYKAGVVERDEKEQGERRLLNLGHTVGHAIEKCSQYTIPHGHAVAAGLAVMARSAEALGWTETPIAARIAACLTKNGLPVSTPYPPELLAEAALADKKRAGGDITVVVPERIGKCALRKMPVTELLPVIRAGWEA